MPPEIATLFFAIGIAGLFWLDRDKSVRTSKALWLPVIWLAIAGSRSVSAWLGMGVAIREAPGQMPETSLLDQLIAAGLMLFGLIVVIRRRKDVLNVLRGSWPIALYFSFALFSLLWSDFPAWGFKRWIRSLGDLVMVLIVATEPKPAEAVRRLLSRVGFVLLPASILLIKYYPQLGQDFDAFGLREFTGVSTSKNFLGDLVFLIGLGAVWQILSLLRDKEAANRRRRLLAYGMLLAFGINVLTTAHCATAVGCSVLGIGLMLCISLPIIRRRPAAVHVLVLALLLGGSMVELLGARAAITQALGRNPDLTGRTEIWKIVIPLAPNPLGGAGFETFWLGPRVAIVFEKVGGLQITNESHNGYVEVYLNLGLLGVCLIAVILVHGYVRAVGAFRRDPGFGGLLVAYVMTAAAYSLTEAGFRMLSLEWYFLLLALVISTRLAAVPQTESELAGNVVGQNLGPLRVSNPATRLGSNRELKPIAPHGREHWAGGKERPSIPRLAGNRKHRQPSAYSKVD